jgi:hypothetical protein
MKMMILSGLVFACVGCLHAQADYMPRDTALRICSEAAVKKYSYRGTSYDKEEARDSFYRACLSGYGQVP